MAVSTMCLSWALPRSFPFPSQFHHFPKPWSRSSACPRAIGNHKNISIKGILYPALLHANTIYLKSAYNVQIVVADDEPEDRLVNRFRKEVLKAGVLQECRRRRFFENKHDKIKRKAREASRRNRKRKPWIQNKRDSEKKKNDAVVDDDDDIDNWDLLDVDVPYT